MPEGPEIRRAADRLGKLLIDRTLVAVWFAFPELQQAAASLVGQRITAVDSWGKALLTHFEDGRVLYSHNQLYGRWMLHACDKPPATARSLLLRLATETHAASLYSASDISLHDDTGALAEHPFLRRLGPDLLTHRVTPDDVMSRLLSPRFRRRGLGGLLLDQHCYAGIGNYLRSEMLFFSGLRPARRPQDLADDELQHLAEVMVATMAQAYREAGVTIARRGVRLCSRPGCRVAFGGMRYSTVPVRRVMPAGPLSRSIRWHRDAYTCARVASAKLLPWTRR